MLHYMSVYWTLYHLISFSFCFHFFFLFFCNTLAFFYYDLRHSIALNSNQTRIRFINIIYHTKWVLVVHHGILFGVFVKVDCMFKPHSDSHKQNGKQKRFLVTIDILGCSRHHLAQKLSFKIQEREKNKQYNADKKIYKVRMICNFVEEKEMKNINCEWNQVCLTKLTHKSDFI